MIVKESGGIKYHYTHIYYIFAGGISSRRRYQERYMLTLLHPKMIRRLSKKGHPDICG
jgi:hypothetical protein